MNKSQRINITFDAEDLEMIQILSKKKKLSVPNLIKRMVRD